MVQMRSMKDAKFNRRRLVRSSALRVSVRFAAIALLFGQVGAYETPLSPFEHTPGASPYQQIVELGCYNVSQPHEQTSGLARHVDLALGYVQDIYIEAERLVSTRESFADQQHAEDSLPTYDDIISLYGKRDAINILRAELDSSASRNPVPPLERAMEAAFEFVDTQGKVIYSRDIFLGRIGVLDAQEQNHHEENLLQLWQLQKAMTIGPLHQLSSYRTSIRKLHDAVNVVRQSAFVASLHMAEAQRETAVDSWEKLMATTRLALTHLKTANYILAEVGMTLNGLHNTPRWDSNASIPRIWEAWLQSYKIMMNVLSNVNRQKFFAECGHQDAFKYCGTAV